MLSMALAFGLLWPLFEPVALPPREVWLSLVVTGLVASAGAFWVQTFVRQRISAARGGDPDHRAGLHRPFRVLAGRDRLLPVQIFGTALSRSGLTASEVSPVVVHTSKPREKGDVSR
jgi:hypothetical protein